jgi:hypothetical protein
MGERYIYLEGTEIVGRGGKKVLRRKNDGPEHFCQNKRQGKIRREKKCDRRRRRRRREREEMKGEAEMNARGTLYLTALKAG